MIFFVGKNSKINKFYYDSVDLGFGERKKFFKNGTRTLALYLNLISLSKYNKKDLHMWYRNQATL